MFWGKPGLGKTAVARALAAQTGAVHLRIDTIEAALARRGEDFGGLRGDIAYVVAYAQARALLAAGHSVIVDAVHGWPGAPALWQEALAGNLACLLRVALTCADATTHRARVEACTPDLPGQTLPTWAQVTAREVTPLPAPDLIIDTAKAAPDTAAEQIAAHLVTPPSP